MAAQFKKSQIDALPFRFEEELERHIKAMEGHRFAEVGIAAPFSHPMIHAAIRRVQYPVNENKPDDFVADYEIIDDAPPLWERKKALVELVERHEEEIANRIWPLPLRRMDMMDLEDLQLETNLTQAEKERKAEIEVKSMRLEALKRKAAHVIATIDVLDETNIGSWTFDLEG